MKGMHRDGVCPPYAFPFLFFIAALSTLLLSSESNIMRKHPLSPRVHPPSMRLTDIFGATLKIKDSEALQENNITFSKPYKMI
ncbi:hypothetical protein BK123_25340 [Paenibacillus lautus]|uniref:Uncharacterized protein n=1 Tax=Paenibacillus lautus TaxID=1401 RepID=A0A1R1AVT8_PAELA|nr:hypothetical protein BK123_25340 [Paenibacillus lautus]